MFRGTRFRLIVARLWAFHQTILVVINLLVAVSVLVIAISMSQEKLEIVRIPICYATRVIEAGEKITMDSGAIACTQVEVAVKDPQSARFSFSPGTFVTSPRGEMIARGRIEANEVVAAHDFVAFSPIAFPALAVKLPDLKADRDYVLVRKIPPEVLEALPFPQEAKYLELQGYCHVIEDGGCLFVVSRFALRDGQERVVFSAAGDQATYEHLVLLTEALGIGGWETNYPANRLPQSE